MSGLVADLQWKKVTVPGGYVEPYQVVGGPNYLLSDAFPTGRWDVTLRYYASIDDRRKNIDNRLTIDDPSFTQVSIPYVEGQDPYQLALAGLQSWFPEGAVTSP